MGMYTRLVLNVALKRDTPSSVIDTLRRMVDGNAESDWGHADRRAWMFKSSSYYHDAIQCAQLVGPDPIDREFKLSVVFDIKNYESEIEKFCDWLAPHVETTRCAGYKLYEECDAPDLLWFKDGKAVWSTPKLSPNELKGAYL